MDIDNNDTILEEEDSVSEESDEDDSCEGSSTEEKMKKIANMDSKKGLKASQMDEDDGVIEERVESENSADESESLSETSDLNKIEEMGLDRNYLMKELGCDSKKVLMDEDLLD